MSIEVMKQALEALEHLKHNAKKSGANMGLALVVAEDAITSLRQAIATEESSATQEPVAWVSPAAPEFYKHEVANTYDWSEWVNPNNDSYMMKCCDCGLVHEMQFKVAKYSKGDECEFVEDRDLQPVFRARRAEEAWQEEDTAYRAGGLPQPKDRLDFWALFDENQRLRAELKFNTHPHPAQPKAEQEPKREPLTDEQLRKVQHHMVDGAYHYSFMQGVRYAEQYHGIKGEA